MPKTRTYILNSGLLWLFGQIVADLIRSTPFHDYARGWAMIGVTLTNFAVIYVLLFQNARRIILYTIGVALGGLLQYQFNPGTLRKRRPLEIWVRLFAELFGRPFCYFGLCAPRSLTAVGILAATAVTNIYMGSRSLAGECFMAAAYLLIEKMQRHDLRDRRAE